MLRFHLNISILLKEYPFLERFEQAARLGFDAVEFWWPRGEDLDQVVQRVRDAGLKVELINFDGGDLARGERGLLNHPERQAEFRANLPVALELAHKLGCRKLNALVGHWLPAESRESQLARVRENLALAAEQARAAGITVVVESLNSWDNGPYILTNTPDSLALLDSVGAPNLAYQYDVYHMQRMEGNVCDTIRRYSERIAHMQIADSPDRHEPGTGELNFPYIFATIAQSAYTGSIGIEYNASTTTEASLAWWRELIAQQS
jgi:Hydroxypyruvate isomerase